MTDSLTQSDIDRIYGRLQEDIDLKNIRNKREFAKQIKLNPKTKKWNQKLNNFFWDVHNYQDKIEKRKIEYISYKKSHKQKAYKRSKGVNWTDYEKKYLLRLKNDGLTAKQISNQIFRTVSSIYTELSRLKGGNNGRRTNIK